MKIADRFERFIINDCTYPGGGTLGPRTQTSLQLFYVYSGHCHVVVDGSERRVGPMQITLLLPGPVERFQFARTEPTHHGYCSALEAVLSVEQRFDYLPCTSVFPLSGKIRDLTDWAKQVANHSDPASVNLYQQIGILLFHEFFRIAGYPETQKPLPAPLSRAKACIDERFATPLDLCDLAHAACVTPTHLIRLFHEHLHTTPMRYLWTVRLEQARQLLTDTGLNISEIAYRCGFSSPAHFSRAFKSSFGLPPAQFRRQQWTIEPSSEGSLSQKA